MKETVSPHLALSAMIRAAGPWVIRPVDPAGWNPKDVTFIDYPSAIYLLVDNDGSPLHFGQSSRGDSTVAGRIREHLCRLDIGQRIARVYVVGLDSPPNLVLDRIEGKVAEVLRLRDVIPGRRSFPSAAGWYDTVFLTRGSHRGADDGQ